MEVFLPYLLEAFAHISSSQPGLSWLLWWKLQPCLPQPSSLLLLPFFHSTYHFLSHHKPVFIMLLFTTCLILLVLWGKSSLHVWDTCIPHVWDTRWCIQSTQNSGWEHSNIQKNIYIFLMSKCENHISRWIEAFKHKKILCVLHWFPCSIYSVFLMNIVFYLYYKLFFPWNQYFLLFPLKDIHLFNIGTCLLLSLNSPMFLAQDYQLLNAKTEIVW